MWRACVRPETIPYRTIPYNLLVCRTSLLYRIPYNLVVARTVLVQFKRRSVAALAPSAAPVTTRTVRYTVAEPSPGHCTSTRPGALGPRLHVPYDIASTGSSTWSQGLSVSNMSTVLVRSTIGNLQGTVPGPYRTPRARGITSMSTVRTQDEVGIGGHT